MTDISWEKSNSGALSPARANSRSKVALFGSVALIVALAAVLFGSLSGGRFFITVNEAMTSPELVGKPLRLSGAVIGDTIRFEAETQTIYFTVAHVTDKMEELEQVGGIAEALHLAAKDPNVTRMPVVVRNQPMPDLLTHEAQAILSGKLGADGVFYADELQLKCPSRLDSAMPDLGKVTG